MNINHKRCRSYSNNKNEINENKIPLTFSLKKESNSERKRQFYLIEKSKIKEKIIAKKICNNSKKLNAFLMNNHFYNPYYIKDNKEYLIKNIIDFFNYKTSISKIYNENSKSYINKQMFEFQKKTLEKEKNEITNLKNVFINYELYFSSFLPNYPYIKLQFCEYPEKKMYYKSYINDLNFITEIFCPRQIGFRTCYFMLFSQNKSNIFIERFLPFFILDLELLNSQNTISGYKKIIDECLTNLFIDSEEYFKFYNLFFEELIQTIYQPFKTLNVIVEKYLPYSKSFEYRITIIINKYSKKLDPENELNNFIEKIKKKKIKNIRLIIRYLLDEQNTNQEILFYLKGMKKDYYEGIYYENLYLFLSHLPCEYKLQFKLLGYNLVNWINIKKCKTLQEIEDLIKKRKNDLKAVINNFYESEEKKNFYLNLTNSLIKKELILDEKVEDIILNIPLEIYSITKFGQLKRNNIIKIKFKNELSKKITNEICESSIINILDISLFNNLDNFIQGGIEERAIQILIKNNSTIFGNFYNKVYKIDSILNNNKENYENMNEKEINNYIENNKKINFFKNNYLNEDFKGNNFLFFQENYNGKDFDFSILKQSLNKISLCVIQTSINKKIYQIKKIIKNLGIKKKFILKKFNYIFPNLKITDFHVLFILSIYNQEIQTINFCKKYQIPFIYFDRKNLLFFDSNLQKINLFEFNNYTLYKKTWEECCEQRYINEDDKEKIDSYYSEEESQDEEDEKIAKENNINLNDISSICLNYNEIINKEINIKDLSNKRKDKIEKKRNSHNLKIIKNNQNDFSDLSLNEN